MFVSPFSQEDCPVRAEASDDGVSEGPARQVQFVEYRQNGNDLWPREEG